MVNVGIPLGSHQRTRATLVRPWPNVTRVLVDLRLYLLSARWTSGICGARARLRLLGAAPGLSILTFELGIREQDVALLAHDFIETLRPIPARVARGVTGRR